MVLLSFIAFIVVCLTVDGIIQIVRRRKAAQLDAASFIDTVFDVQSISIPKGIHFAKSHTWAFMDLYGDVKTGIDDFIQQITGSITRLELKNSGESVKKGDPFITIIQNGKRIILNAPVSGTIKSQNKEVLENLSLLNTSPYTLGWIYSIEPSNWIKESQIMMMAEKASEWIKSEYTRFKDFLAYSINKQPDGAAIAFQDGGSLKSNILESMGPEIWEEFQSGFLDVNK